MDGILLEGQEGSGVPLLYMLPESWSSHVPQLFARRGQLPPEKAASPWTTFDMVLREAAPIPVAFDFTRFLASSITFMTYLADVSLFFDDKCLARIKKTAGVPKELGIPKGLHNTSSSGMVTIRNIRSTRNSRLSLQLPQINTLL